MPINDGFVMFVSQVYRVYSNNQEFEVTRLTDQLTSYGDETKLIIKLGRALKLGETRIKVYLFRPNEEEVRHVAIIVFACSLFTIFISVHLSVAIRRFIL